MWRVVKALQSLKHKKRMEEKERNVASSSQMATLGVPPSMCCQLAEEVWSLRMPEGILAFR